MKMLVHDVERCAGHRQREQGSHHSHPHPTRRGLFEEPADDAPASPDQQENREDLPEQFRPGKRHSGAANEGGHPCVEDAGPHLQLKESRVVGEKRWVQVRLDRG